MWAWINTHGLLSISNEMVPIKDEAPWRFVYWYLIWNCVFMVFVKNLMYEWNVRFFKIMFDQSLTAFMICLYSNWILFQMLDHFEPNFCSFSWKSIACLAVKKNIFLQLLKLFYHENFWNVFVYPLICTGLAWRKTPKLFLMEKNLM